MISVLGKNKRLDEATEILAVMKKEDCHPDNFTYASLFDGVGRATDLPKEEQYPICINRLKYYGLLL